MCSLPRARVPGVRRPISGLTAVHTDRVQALRHISSSPDLATPSPLLYASSYSFVPIDTFVSLMAEPPFDPFSSVVFTTVQLARPNIFFARPSCLVFTGHLASKVELVRSSHLLHLILGISISCYSRPGCSLWVAIVALAIFACHGSFACVFRPSSWFFPPLWRPGSGLASAGPIGQPSAIGHSAMLPTQAATPAVVLDHRPMSSVVANGPGIAPPPVHALSDPVPAGLGAIAATDPSLPPVLPDRWTATGTTGNFTPGFGSRFGDRVLPIGPYLPLG